MRKNDWCLDRLVFVYPEGVDKPELNAPPGEVVCASITDVFYFSVEAAYFRKKTGAYVRLPWSDIEVADWRLRKVNNAVVQAMAYKTTSDQKFVVPMPFDGVPRYFYQVHEACIAELTPGGKVCKLPGPVRLAQHACPRERTEFWDGKVEASRIMWSRTLRCPCEHDVGFQLRYLGRMLDDGTIADGDLRQKVIAGCDACGQDLELFDSFRHGYNAVICRERDREPPGREANSNYECGCGGRSFRLGVAATYDADDEDLVGRRKADRSEAYGWFTTFAQCRACDKVSTVVDYETA